MAAWKLRHSFRYKKSRESATDYLAEFDHANLRRARASILWFDDWAVATKRQIQILDALGLIRDNATIIDYGCGIGRISQAIAEQYSARVLSVDRSSDMLQHARGYITDAFFTNGTVELLLDTDLVKRSSQLQKAVDTILMIEVLQHVPEPIIDHLLPQLIQLLKPTGKLFVFGNSNIDVAADGSIIPDTPTVEVILRRHARIERRDVWAKDFAVPRHSFVCTY